MQFKEGLKITRNIRVFAIQQSKNSEGNQKHRLCTLQECAISIQNRVFALRDIGHTRWNRVL
jgi:hypothetical protein